MVHQILEDAAALETEDVICWADNGTSFHISNPRTFNDTILPKYTNKRTKFRSFQRQLNIYGFKMTKKSGVYRNQLFRRGHMQLISRIRPRTAALRKKLSEQADSCSSSDTKVELETETDDFAPVTPPIQKSDEKEDLDIVEDIGYNNQDEKTETMFRSISLEKLEQASKQIENDKSQDDCIPDIAARADEDGLLFSNDTRTESCEQKICEDGQRDFDFDLFDDLDEFTFCPCSGSGCCYNTYRIVAETM